MNLFEHLVTIGAIKYGKFKLASGVESDVYLDIKFALLTNNAPIIESLLPKLTTKSIAGYGLGGTLLVGCILGRSNNHVGVIIRDKIKEHGTQLAVEGIVDEVTLLEDVITSGNSVQKAMTILKENKFTIKNIITVINRNDINYINGVPVTSLLAAKDIKRNGQV